MYIVSSGGGGGGGGEIRGCDLRLVIHVRREDIIHSIFAFTWPPEVARRLHKYWLFTYAQ